MQSAATTSTGIKNGSGPWGGQQSRARGPCSSNDSQDPGGRYLGQLAVPITPTAPRKRGLKRLRDVSFESYPTSKFRRLERPHCIDVDSDVFGHPELKTPTTINTDNDNEKAPTVNPPHNLKETTPQSREVDDLMTIHEAKAHEYMLGKVPAVSEDSSSAAEDEDTESSGPSSSPRSINDPSGDNQRHHSPHGMTESAFTDEGLRHPSPDTVRRIIQMGRNSPGSRSERRYTAPPVSYIPADQPNGPRQLPPDRYSCPLTGCHCPLGAEKEGYDRKGLGYHILLSHGGSDNMLEVRQQVRDRVMALRSECGRGVGATGSPFWRSHRSTFDLQLQMDGLVRDLDEIREWEHTRRFIVPPSSWGTWIEFNQLRQSEEDEFARENHANEYQCGFSSPFLPRVNPFARQGGKPSHQSKEEIRVQQELELCHSMTVQRRFEAIHVQSPRSAGHGFCPVNSSQDNLDTGHCELNLGGNSMDID